MNQKAVERWLNFIHVMSIDLAKIALPEENLVKEIILMYQKYLLSDSFPQLFLTTEIWFSRNLAEKGQEKQSH